LTVASHSCCTGSIAVDFAISFLLPALFLRPNFLLNWLVTGH